MCVIVIWLVAVSPIYPVNGNSIVISTAVQTMGKGTRPDWREWGKIHGGRGVGGRAAAQSITGLPFGQFGSKTGHPGAVFGGEPWRE